MEEKAVIIFDGDCNFCSKWVLWVIKHDTKDFFRFTASQSGTGIDMIQNLQLENIPDKSVILISNKRIYTRSDAALHIAKKLNGIIPIFYAFIIIPGFIRNFVYDFISRNRYKWFGKKPFCFIPTEEIKAKFL